MDHEPFLGRNGSRSAMAERTMCKQKCVRTIFKILGGGPCGPMVEEFLEVPIVDMGNDSFYIAPCEPESN
jgi:hypothetical protein